MDHKMTKPLIRLTSDLPEGHWMRRHSPDNTSLRPYAEDRVVSVLTGAAIDAIEEAGISRVEVARLLGTTKSYVSQVLNGSTNMTVKTLGALLWASGQQVRCLETEPIGTTWDEEAGMLSVASHAEPTFETTITISHTETVNIHIGAPNDGAPLLGSELGFLFQYPATRTQ
jgi:transcriptional regulator with XRE-family HTH domain